MSIEMMDPVDTLRDWECFRKRKYYSEAKAERAASIARVKNFGDGRPPIGVYACSYGHHWHVGHAMTWVSR